MEVKFIKKTRTVKDGAGVALSLQASIYVSEKQIYEWIQANDFIGQKTPTRNDAIRAIGLDMYANNLLNPKIEHIEHYTKEEEYGIPTKV